MAGSKLPKTPSILLRLLRFDPAITPFNTSTRYKGADYFTNAVASMTRPDESLSIEDILTKHVRKRPSNPVYNEGTLLLDPRKFDLIDVANRAKLLAKTQSNLQRTVYEEFESQRALREIRDKIDAYPSPSPDPV